MGLSYFISKLGCIGIVFVWTFIVHNLFSFGSTSDPSESEVMEQR